LSHIRETWRRTWGDAVPREPAKPGRRLGSSAAADDPVSPGIDDVEAGDVVKILRDLAGLG
jgi:hypothetical protein